MHMNNPGLLNSDSSIYVAGHRGLVGSAIVRNLQRRGIDKLITATHSELDLTNQRDVAAFFDRKKPEYVVLAAAKVGGIHANNEYPADFIYENLMVEANVIHSSFQNGVKRLLFLGSSCIYPQAVKQPMREDALLTGILEPTNEPYAVAKIAGIKLCESYNRQYGTDFRSIMPTNLYGTGDNFHAENSHVIPALIRRFHEAKANNEPEVIVWGSGKPRREFLSVDDMAAASLFVLELDQDVYRENTEPMLSHINIGSGIDCTIAELAQTVKDVVGFTGGLKFDASKPDGTPRKLMDVSRLKSLGWESKISLREGLELTYHWYLENIGKSGIRV
jgi:GDP-L-fucose synthase